MEHIHTLKYIYILVMYIVLIIVIVKAAQHHCLTFNLNPQVHLAQAIVQQASDIVMITIIIPVIVVKVIVVVVSNSQVCKWSKIYVASIRFRKITQEA